MFPMARLLIPVSFLIAGLAGCGSSDYELASVSGKVTLNGEPLPDALVNFEPTSEKSFTGPGSHGLTDAQGQSTLTTVEGSNGAVVGSHVVRITTRKLNEEGAMSDANVLLQSRKGNPNATEEKVPLKYLGGNSPLTFVVPRGGSNAANFDLSGPPPPPIANMRPGGNRGRSR